jgi:pantoate--beta-alanine ligase
MVVPEALAAVRAAFEQGDLDARELCELAAQVVALQPLARLEYVDIVHPQQLHQVDPVTPGARVVIAVWFDDVRLIDNIALPG